MDPDLVTQRLLSGLMFLGGALVVGLVATWLVGWVGRRAHLPGGLVALAQVLTPVALFYAGSLYLDTAGAVAAAQVETKDENISYNSRIPGDWTRSFWATVRFDAAEGPTQAVLWLDEATYDGLRPGAALDVRYVTWFPHIARPASESTRSLVPWRWLVVAGAAGGIGVGPWLLLRRRSPVLKGVAFIAALFAAAIWLIYPTPWLPPLDEPVVTTMAEVRGVRTETRALMNGRSSRQDAPQPYDVVELHFVPQGRDQVVVAVDSVDTGSAPGLEVGARFPVRYNAGDPRRARLPGARTYRWREWVTLGANILGVIGLFVGFVLLSKLARFWWRKLTQPS